MYSPYERPLDAELPPGRMGHAPLERRGRAACALIASVLGAVLAIGWSLFVRSRLYAQGPALAEERILTVLRDEAYAERKDLRRKARSAGLPPPARLPEVPERCEVLSFEPETLGTGWLLVTSGRMPRPVRVDVTVRDRDGTERGFVVVYETWGLSEWRVRKLE